jgi:hypothetical protein
MGGEAVAERMAPPMLTYVGGSHRPLERLLKEAFRSVKPADRVALGSGQRVDKWLAESIATANGKTTNPNQPVEVVIEGFSLSTGITNRSYTATPPSTLTISWP